MQQQTEQTVDYKKHSFDFPKAVQEVITNNLPQQIRVQFSELFPSIQGSNSNIRHKLKLWKKIMLTNQNEIKGQNRQKQVESLRKSKEIIRKYLSRVLVEQYVIGDLEQKNIMINLLRSIDLQPQTIQNIHSDIKTFLQLRLSIEVLDILGKQKVRSPILTEDVQQIYKKIVQQLVKGQKMIVNNQFRTKWLQAFVQVLRSINIIHRLVLFSTDLIQKVLHSIKNCLEHYQLLPKEVLTQLYLVLLFLSPEQPVPSENLRVMHYLNAQAIIHNKKTLSKLLPLVQNLKDTEQKCQLAPILLKAFELQFINYDDKDNAFDQVIQLFQSGRSVYSYLQGIITIIVKNGALWNLQGNMQRKFFVARILLKFVKSEDILKQWPNFLSDAIENAGSMTVAYSAECAEGLLEKLYKQNNQDYEKWSAIWMPFYWKQIQQNSRSHTRGLIEFINPAIVRICPKPVLLQQLLNQKKVDSNNQLPLISLLKCYKDLGKIVFRQENNSFCYIQTQGQAKFQDKIIQLKFEDMKNMLLSSDLMVVYKALEFLAHLQKPSELLNSLQYDLLLFFYKNSMRTSNAEFRQNYLTITKKLLDRLRTNYDRQITNRVKKPKQKQKPRYQQMKNFIRQLINVCYQNIYVEAIYQVIQPALQILIIVTHYFGNNDKQVKKGQMVIASKFLQENTSFYEFQHFQNLIICLESSYQSIRNSASIILDTFSELKQIDLLEKLWKQSLVLTNKLGIRHYEFACRIVAFLSKRYYDKISHIPKIYEHLKILNVCECLLQIMKQRYKVFTEEFSKQTQIFYKNLIHGILTCFSYLFEQIGVQLNGLKCTLKQAEWIKCCEQVKDFMNRFMLQINQILLFSVEISSSNISTVVLDTLMPGSQSKNKGMKVDCRGHFLSEKIQQKSNTIGKFLQSSALISSMQNQQQGIQNTLVVSFYLLTRQAGLVFQSLASLLSNSDSLTYLPVPSLSKLINAYFYALINLKHMGSVDRISIGLSKMSKVIFKHSDKELAKLPENLLNKLLDLLQQGQFTNILRRSAGVPYAFSCLLKSEAVKRKSLIDKAISTLLGLANQQTAAAEFKIHSLNILKRLFQDSDLKQDLDLFLSKAFITSMKGFSSQDWNIRNSSLMLFSTLANRTLGIKPTFNLLQFFHKCPDLLPYMEQQLKKPSTGTMYPSLYPLVLLLSRLLPFDLKQKARMTIRGQNSIKQLRKEELLKLLPLVESAGNNNNYMGRAMTAKAILPFMEISSIIPYCLGILRNSPNSTMNATHYDILRCYHLIVSYHQIVEQQNIQHTTSQKVITQIIDILLSKAKLLSKLKCPTVQQVLVKIYNEFLTIYDLSLRKHQESYAQLISKVSTHSIKLLQQTLYTQQHFIVQQDLGASKLRQATIKLYFGVLFGFDFSAAKPDFRQLQKFVKFLIGNIMKDTHYLQKIDTQVVSQYMGYTYKLIKNNNEIHDKVTQIVGELISKIPDLSILPDTVLTALLQIAKILKLDLGSTKYLQVLAHKTKNTNLQVQLFKYINNHGLPIDDLLYAFSSPEQLQQLRVCCLQYLEQQKQTNPKHYLVYIRLLQDQQPEIRKQAAQQLARCLNLYQYNDAVLKNHFLRKLNKDQFKQLLLENTDYQTKKKNNVQERIFAYDKPNKFRTDIETLAYIISDNENLETSDIKKIITDVNHHQNLQFSPKEAIKQYNQDILARNQFKFQNLLRAIVLSQERDQCQKISKKHPILQKVFLRMKNLMN